jgi:hypothetical protein
MKHCHFFLGIYIFAVLGTFYPEIQQTLFAQQRMRPKEENVCFRWAFARLKAEGQNQILIPISGDTTLKTGDQFKFFFELQKDCFVYLFYHSSQDLLEILFSNDLQQFNQGFKVLRKNYIPPGNQWFVLDNHVGIETFYLLASAQRLNHLEFLFGQYMSAQFSQKDELKQKILKEIKYLRWQNRNFKKHVERPVPIIGSRRGLEKVDKSENFDVADLSIEICSQDFYSRTFTIDHQE